MKNEDELRAMSTEELGAYLDNPTNDVSEVVEETQSEEGIEAAKEGLKDEPVFYKNKSDEELKGMLDNTKSVLEQKEKTRAEILVELEQYNKEISRKNNDIYQNKKKIEEVRAIKEKDIEEDEILSKYEKEDLLAIEKVIEKKLNQKQRQEEENKKQYNESRQMENERTWSQLQLSDPDFVKNHEQEIISLIKANPERTLYNDNWVLSFYIDNKNKKGIDKVKTNSDNTLLKRKVEASTASGGNKIAGISNGKSITEMTERDMRALSADELEAYISKIKR